MNENSEPSGVLLINKPSGITSHDVVYIVRRAFHTKRVGHTGTLDPMATGVLVVLVGRAAKACEYITHDSKRYTARLRLGITTDTEDITGKVLTQTATLPDRDTVLSVSREFTGKLMQIPPMYSALKVDGKKLCDLAREGITVERQPRGIEIFSLECTPTDTQTDYILNMHCSGGTYIRTLCADIGARLGCGGVMASLTRTETGGFPLSDCIGTEQLKTLSYDECLSRLLPVEALFSELPEVNLTGFYLNLIYNGCGVDLRKLKLSLPCGYVRLLSDGRFFALGSVSVSDDGTYIMKAEKLFEFNK